MYPYDAGSKCEETPVGILKGKRATLSRVHALEIARRMTERGGSGPAPMTSMEMNNPMEQGQTADPTTAWPGAIGQGMPGMDPTGGMMG